MFEPDIVVTERGDYADRHIVVEVKASPSALDRVETELCDYMVRNRFPLGMLVSVGEIRLFRDRYLSYRPDSVERIGVYPIAEFDDFKTMSLGDRDQIERLEGAVQAWIERLPATISIASLDDGLRKALSEDFVPYVQSGEVRAAHHRHRMLRASDSRTDR